MVECKCDTFHGVSKLKARAKIELEHLMRVVKGIDGGLIVVGVVGGG